MAMMVLVFAIAFIGCEPEPNTNTETDTWSAVTDLSQLDGRWVGSRSVTISLQDYLDDDPLKEQFKNLDVKVNLIDTHNRTININEYGNGSGYSEETTYYKYHGKDVKTFWDYYSKDEEGNYYDDYCVTYGNRTYYITYDHENYTSIIKATSTLNEGDVAFYFYISLEYNLLEINQNGTKIRERSDDSYFNDSYLILTKQ